MPRSLRRANAFWGTNDTAVTFALTPTAKATLSCVANNLAEYNGGYSQTERYSEITWAGTDETIAWALEDFRRLGALDLQLNHPSLA